MVQMKNFAAICITGTAVFALNTSFAADACKNRGELDNNYCDENNDLHAIY
jgi:hypothetical protein